MSKDITLSDKTMTSEQIEKLLNNFRDVLRKQGSQLNREAFQKVLKNKQLGSSLFAVIRDAVEAVSDMIVRVVHVDNSLSAQEAFEATGRSQYYGDSIMATVLWLQFQSLKVEKL